MGTNTHFTIQNIILHIIENSLCLSICTLRPTPKHINKNTGCFANRHFHTTHTKCDPRRDRLPLRYQLISRNIPEVKQHTQKAFWSSSCMKSARHVTCMVSLRSRSLRYPKYLAGAFRPLKYLSLGGSRVPHGTTYTGREGIMRRWRRWRREARDKPYRDDQFSLFLFA